MRKNSQIQRAQPLGEIEEYAGSSVTMKTYPDRICLYHEEKLIARHTRSYNRNRDIENRDHPKALLAKRRQGGMKNK